MYKKFFILFIIMSLFVACKKVQIEEPSSTAQQAQVMVNQLLKVFISKDLSKIDQLVAFPLLMNGKFYNSKEELMTPIERFHMEFKSENIAQMRFVFEEVQVMTLQEFRAKNLPTTQADSLKGLDSDLVAIYHTNRLYAGEKLIDKDERAVMLLFKHPDGQWKIKGLI